MPQRFNLTEIVRQLMLSRELRGRFNRNPEAVMSEFFLTDEERHILYSMDATTISPEVFPPIDTQVGAFNIPQGEFRPAGPNCVPDPGVAMPVYPAPKPGLFRVRPRQVTPADLLTVKDNPGNVTASFFEISVFGQSLSRDPLPLTTITHKASGATLTIDTTRVFGTMRCSQLTLLVVAPTTAAGVGDYEIEVTNCPGTAHQDVIGNKLELRVGP